jgi:hypothetical protein
VGVDIRVTFFLLARTLATGEPPTAGVVPGVVPPVGVVVAGGAGVVVLPPVLGFGVVEPVFDDPVEDFDVPDDFDPLLDDPDDFFDEDEPPELDFFDDEEPPELDFFELDFLLPLDFFAAGFFAAVVFFAAARVNPREDSSAATSPRAATMAGVTGWPVANAAPPRDSSCAGDRDLR